MPKPLFLIFQGYRLIAYSLFGACSALFFYFLFVVILMFHVSRFTFQTLSLGNLEMHEN